MDGCKAKDVHKFTKEAQKNLESFEKWWAHNHEKSPEIFPSPLKDWEWFHVLRVFKAEGRGLLRYHLENRNPKDWSFRHPNPMYCFSEKMKEIEERREREKNFFISAL